MFNRLIFHLFIYILNIFPGAIGNANAFTSTLHEILPLEF